MVSLSSFNDELSGSIILELSATACSRFGDQILLLTVDRLQDYSGLLEDLRVSASLVVPNGTLKMIVSWTEQGQRMNVDR